MYKILTVTEISNYLQNQRLCMIEKESGVSYPTIRKLADMSKLPAGSKKPNFTTNVLDKMSRYIHNQRRRQEKLLRELELEELES